ncbi:MAG TPA: hypothetical protein VFU23_08230 [Gemmatimonadales bacterium]|nr:hypothetical protein [Gemmatimonadales bacterium]
MKNHAMYCSGCDRQVRVLITPGPVYDGRAPLHDEELVCLEIGSRCTGNMCPLGAAGPPEMIRRVIRNGIPLETLNTVTARCPSCEEDQDIVLYGDGRAICSHCLGESRWAVDHLEPSA